MHRLFLELDGMDLEEHNGVTCHKATKRSELFGIEIPGTNFFEIRRRMASDLTPLDLFLWNYVKSLIYLHQ